MEPNVLLIVLDAARADHFSVYDYPRPTTPSIDAIADEGTVFDSAFAAAPWTPPSHGSLFSGTYPSTHGYLDGGMRFQPPHLTLAERLKDAGYATFGSIQNAKIGSETDVTRGFDELGDIFRLPFKPESLEEFRQYYFDLIPGYLKILQNLHSAERKPAEYLSVEYLTTRIRRYADQQPFFGFININAPHSKYAPPEPYRDQFTKTTSISDKEVVSDLADRGGYRYMARELQPSEDDWEAVKDLYDGEIAFADSLIQQIKTCLLEVGEYDDTMIIITADHGEHFGEHHRAYHQFSLYDELLHVPLIIKPPSGQRRNHCSQLVSHLDIYPTILSQLNLDVPESVEGYDLFGRKEREAVFAEYGEPKTAITTLKNYAARELSSDLLSEYDHALQCVRTKEQKYIRVVGGEDQILALRSSGSPKESLLKGNEGDGLEEKLTNELGDDLSVEPQKANSKAVRENLKDLGYL